MTGLLPHSDDRDQAIEVGRMRRLLTIVFARRKLLWNDELYTYYIATLPSLGDI